MVWGSDLDLYIMMLQARFTLILLARNLSSWGSICPGPQFNLQYVASLGNRQSFTTKSEGRNKATLSHENTFHSKYPVSTLQRRCPGSPLQS